MTTIDDLFKTHTATATGFRHYSAGEVAYVTNGFGDNGVIGFVDTLPNDKVFNFVGLVVSAFCETTVQIPPFIARGNGGSGLLVLEPKKDMSSAQLAYIAAYINTTLRWRFSWSRVATVDRIKNLQVPNPKSPPINYRVRDLLPPRTTAKKLDWKLKMRSFPLDALFCLEAGDYHNAAVLTRGDIPLISCGDRNNGICAFVDVPIAQRQKHRLTIAFNGMNTLTTKFHPYEFAAKDDVAVCTPRAPLRDSTLFFVQVMMAREQWRYNFYRKCFLDKLSRQSVELPAQGKMIDENTIEAVVSTSPYWRVLSERFKVSEG